MGIPKYPKFASLALFSLLALLFTSCTRQEESVSQKELVAREILVADALTDFDAGRYNQALRKLEALLQEYPQDSSALQVKSMVLVSLGRYEEAIEALEKLAARQPDNIDVQFHLGTLYFNRRMWGKAVAHLEKATARPDRETKARELLWKCYQNLGQPEAAAAQLENLLKLRPQDPTLLTLMGDYLVTKHRYAQAIKRYREALEIKPRLAAAYERIATCQASLEQFDEAIETLTAAVKKIPEDPGLSLTLVQAYLQVARPADALSEIDRFEAMHGKSKETQLLRNAAEDLLSPERTQRTRRSGKR